jgi:O-antigen ligase
MIPTGLILGFLFFAILTDSVDSAWINISFRAIACSLAAVALFRSAIYHRLRCNWSVAAFCLPACWGLIQLGSNATVWRFATWNSTLLWIAYLALFIAASQLEYGRSTLLVMAYFGGIYSLSAIAQFFLWQGSGERMIGTFRNHNHYAALLELLFPVVLWRLFRDQHKLLLGTCALTILASVVVSGSRAGILLLILEGLYLGLIHTEKPLKVLAGTFMVAVVACAMMWPRLEKLSTSEPYQSRNVTARASIRMIRERPLTGFGLGTWANVYPAFAVHDTGFRLIHADNDWLEWAAEGGLPFAVIMLLIAAIALRAAWSEPWAIGCVAVLLHSLVEFPMQKPALWACFTVVLGMSQTRRNSDIARRKHSS